MWVQRPSGRNERGTASKGHRWIERANTPETRSFRFTLHLREGYLAPVSRLPPNKSEPPGYKSAPDASLPINNHQSGGEQKLMVSLPEPANYVRGHNAPPQSNVCQDRCSLLASMNACLELGEAPSHSPVSEAGAGPKLKLE